MTFMSDVEPVDPEDLFPGFIRLGEVTHLVGGPGAGKGLVGDDLLYRAAVNRMPPPWPVAGPWTPPELVRLPGTGITISLEDDDGERTWHSLNAAAGGNRDNPAWPVLDRVDTMRTVTQRTGAGSTLSVRFSLNDDLGKLDARIDELNRTGRCDCRQAFIRAPRRGWQDTAVTTCPAHNDGKHRPVLLGPCLLIRVDPVTAAATKSISWNQQVRHGLIEPLQELAKAKHVGVLLVNHFYRGVTDTNMIEKTAGSKAIVDACRINLVVRPHPEKQGAQLIATLKSNGPDLEPLTYRVVKSGEPPLYQDTHIEWDLPADAYETEQGRQALEEQVYAELAASPGPLCDAQLAAWFGLANAGIARKVCKALADQGRVEPIRGGWRVIPALPAAPAIPATGSNQPPWL